ncbi:hypothetical protein ACHHYP_16677 [Achlya hypogyna]|uniref:Trafficking protein particle complex subunit 8 n=1 Tax=Achlya hypogyna TaxID=1202772 RepID=A0A1V9Y643_ACHHY|nr:hypothetical protein ACHHYP_16677 [Achlya hypogyna]
MDLGTWAHTAFAPVVLLNTTKEAERICAKNGGLSVEQLLNAYGVFANANTPIRTVNGHVNLPEVRMRFLHASNMHATPVADSSARINQVVADSALLGDELHLPTVTTEDDVPGFLRAVGGTAREPLPWYGAFKHELFESFQCEETSMIYHPHANLLVVSSTEGDPRHAFHQLASPQALPQVFQDGLYDMNIPKFYIVLHDVTETHNTSIDADAIFRNLGLPANSGGVVHINSLAAPNLASAPSWTNHPYVRSLSELEPATPFGCYLADSDHQSIRNMLWDLATKCLLPQMEAKLHALNETVAAVKKGVKNAIRSWWRKPKDTTVRSSAYVYRYDSIESNMRLLADLAFCVHDYDLALSMYRLVRDDYKTDKALLHCAHANEGIALCLFLLRGSVPQIHNAIESCIGIYARLAVTAPQCPTVRHATRTAVLASEIYAALFAAAPASDLMDAASAALIRGSSAADPSQPAFGVCAAVLLERAAFCDLLSRTAKFRKYGFRMVMAGHVYATLGHTPHAARCYASARAVYANSRWFSVDDHITGTLAKQLYSLARPQEAIALLLTRIGSGRHTKAQQQHLLTEFYDMVSECLADAGDALPDFHLIETTDGPQKVLLVKNLAIPAIADASVVVFAPMNAAGPVAPVDVDDAAWKHVQFALAREEKIQALAQAAPAPHWRELATASAAALQLPVRVAGKKVGKAAAKTYVVHEWIYVEFELQNHLACDVVLSQLHLFGTIDDAAFPGAAAVEVEYQDLTMAPFADSKVRLRLLPRAVGAVAIQGVRWALNTAVHGEHAFQLPGILLQDSLQHRANRVRAPNDATRCVVGAAQPWLGVALAQSDGRPLPAPLVCMEGEVLVLALTLTNHGSAPLTELTIACFEWAYVLEAPGRAVGSSGSVTALDGVALAPGASQTLRLVCQSLSAGTQTVRFLFRYNGGRIVPVVVEAETLACLQLSHAIHPSYDRAGEYVLALTVANARKDGTKEAAPRMALLSALAYSAQWTLVPFAPREAHVLDDAVRPGTSLQWQETAALYFRLVPRTPGADPLHAVPLAPDENAPQYPVLCFLALQHAAERVLDFKKKKLLEQGGNKAQLLRSIQSVRRDNKQQPAGANGDSVPSFEQMDLHVVVQWAGTGPVVNGQQRQRCFGQSTALNIQVRTPYVATSSACPLTMTLDFPPVAAPGAVAMTLHVRNDAAPGSPPITFTLETLQPEEEHPSVRSATTGATTAARVFWAGVTRQTVTALSPLAPVAVPLTAVFAGPGIYDLNRFRFVIQRESQRPLTVFFPVEYLVRVA